MRRRSACRCSTACTRNIRAALHRKPSRSSLATSAALTGEYNWGVQPGLKNLTDHFLEEWFWRPAAIVSYSGGRFSGARAATAWHGILSEMGMVVVSSTIAVGPIGQALSAEGEPAGEAGQALERAFPRFADDLSWWVEAAKMQRQYKPPPY